jgi:hypothetical protein
MRAVSILGGGPARNEGRRLLVVADAKAVIRRAQPRTKIRLQLLDLPERACVSQ